MRFLLILAGVLVSTGTPAQAPYTPPPDELQAAADADELRGALERRLAQVNESAQNLQAAIDAIDAGEPAEDVRDRLTESWRDRASDFRGARGLNTQDRGPRGPSDRERRSADLSPQERERALALLEEIDPDGASRLRQQLEDDPRGSRVFAQLLPRLAEMDRLRGEDAEMFELKRDEFRTGRAVAGFTRGYFQSGQDEASRELLAEAVREHLAVRSRVRTLEITRLEERLEVLREEVSSFDLDAQTDAAIARILERARRGRRDRDSQD